ncbi:CRISPR-associated helicase Cas3' [Marinimicrococcus flavescens]|uniref:CRISPR-associated helicase Cas3 n=1 Tax=Marinimicrococcus flavescens TaxID=3031815 RepID=A0AAP3XRX0_9PROT|nr:CRISPR-associated helicase Cas3' [Marinimicrococcus flavescens]
MATHLTAVAARAAAFGQPFRAGKLAEAAGLLHDVGKVSARFQAYLRGQAASTDHSTAGAQLAVQRYDRRLGKLLAYAVAGHHSGLADGVSGENSCLSERLRKSIEPYERWQDVVRLPASLSPPAMELRRDRQGFQLAFFVRMLFSCLVDADILETERFSREKDRERWPDLLALRPPFEGFLAGKAIQAPDTAVNRLRSSILAHVRGQAGLEPGLFSLTVPTGGGKTLLSLAFALDHAAAHGLRRVINVIPFTSVVEQTADVFRQALGPDAVLEHHSAFDSARLPESADEEELPTGLERHRQAAENWDAPVVVTTAVQLFESLFAARPGRCRKLHNLARSVIVLDEAQTLPLHLLRPCVAALDELARNYGASIVLMTATQPALREPDLPGGLEKVRELAPEGLDREPAFRRVTVEHGHDLDESDLAGRLRRERQVLCIVNTRRHAKELFEAIRGQEGARHLSTLMCAAHRRKILAEIRDRLRGGAPVRLVATSLVEAGVDISFPLVLRAEAGLDQIAQAAGRCNREGELDGLGRVLVFRSIKHEPPPEVAQRAAAGRAALRRFPDDPLGPDAIWHFFKELYLVKGPTALDRERVLELLAEKVADLDFPFATLAERFRMIEDVMVPVLIPYNDEARSLLDRLEVAPFIGRIARALQPYTVQVPRQARGALLAAGAARSVREADFPGQFVALVNNDIYDSCIGLTWDDPSFRRSESSVI